MSDKYIYGIDASNIRAGGGITHLKELLNASDPIKHGFEKIVVWSGNATLDELGDFPWLIKITEKKLNGNLFHRIFWQKFKLSQRVAEAGCKVLFVPGGSFSCSYRPIVTLSQNMLPFEKKELLRFGFSWMTIKLFFLRLVQGSSFRKSDGVIYLTKYAEETITKEIGKVKGITRIIPHGISPAFFTAPRQQKAYNKYTTNDPFRIVYVSIIDVYKHQWKVAEAIAALRKEGLPVTIEFIGPAYASALEKLKRVQKKIDPDEIFIKYAGIISHDRLTGLLKNADLFLFASTCENMPNILLEGMASGLPIACSDRGPMPEMLGDAGIYFNPEETVDIAEAIKKMVESPELRETKARESFEKAKYFSWEKCADKTLAFLYDIATKNNHRNL